MSLLFISEEQMPSGLRMQAWTEKGVEEQQAETEKQANNLERSSVLVMKRQDLPSLKAPSLRLIPYSFLIYISSSQRLSLVSFSVFTVKEFKHSKIQCWVNPKELSIMLIQLQGMFLYRRGRDCFFSSSILLPGSSSNWMSILVPDRLRLLSRSRPRAEKGQLIQEAILPTISELKKVFWQESASILMAKLLLPLSCLTPYTYRHTLHILDSRQSIFSSIYSTKVATSLFLPTPPTKQIFSLLYKASNARPDFKSDLTVNHSRVSRLKHQIWLQIPRKSLSLRTVPPISIMQGLSRFTSTAEGDPRGFLCWQPVETVTKSTSSFLSLKSINLN